MEPVSRLRLAAIAAIIGFVVGAMTIAVLVWKAGVVADPAATSAAPAPVTSTTVVPRASPATEAAVVKAHTTSPIEPPPVEKPDPPAKSDPPSLDANPISELRRRELSIPLETITRSTLRSSFNEKRGTRVHEAMDLLAPRHTPIVAVEHGTVAKLFESKAGGITIYQFDPTTSFVYYYAHLERYAAGLREGGQIRRGQVLGYVGTSGNAPPNTPHLHFAIFKLTDKKRWWEGTPIDPYEVLR